MAHIEAYGKLRVAAVHGGPAAVWNIARGKGPVAEMAREALELATSPLHNDISLVQAIDLLGEKKG